MTAANAESGGIGALRRSAGLTQQDLAERAACSIGMVRMLEAGAVPRQSEVLPRVIAVLNDGAPAGNGRDATTSTADSDRPDMREDVKYMEKPRDYPGVLAAVEYEIRLRLEDYGVRRPDPEADAHAVVHTMLRFGWRPTGGS